MARSRRKAGGNAKRRNHEPQGHGPTDGTDELAGYSLIALVITVAYGPSLTGGWIWDDRIFVERNPHLLTPSGIYDIWFRHDKMVAEVHYWPLTYTTLWLENQLWGLNPMPYRATNLALHVANSCLVHRLCRRIGLPPGSAWLSAFLFALHPTHVESVAWVLERKDLLSGLFYLLALLWHPSTDASVPGGFVPNGETVRRTIVALGLYVLGMLSKSIVVSLPIVLLALPWMYRGVIRRCEVAYAAPFFAAGLAISLWDMIGTRGKDYVGFDLTFLQRVLLVCRAVCFYVYKLIWPADLVMIYPRWHLEHDQWLWGVCLVVTMSAPLVLWVLRHRVGRGPITALVLFVGTLGPTLGIIDYSYMQYSYVADRYQYLAEIAPIVLFTGVSSHKIGMLRKASKVRMAVVPAAGLLVAVLGWRTWLQSHAYLNDEAFFGYISNRRPEGFHGWFHLGSSYFETKRHDQAANCFARAETIFSERQDTEPHIRELMGERLFSFYGTALVRAGRQEEGIVKLEESLIYNPSNPKALIGLGNALSELGQNKEASEYFRRALSINPNYAVGWNNYGSELFRLGRTEESEGAFRKAVEVQPSYRKGRFNLAISLEQLGRHSEAVEQYREILERYPGDSGAKENLNAALARVQS